MEISRRLVAYLVTFGVLGTLGTACVAPPRNIDTVEGTEQEDIPVPKRFELRHSYSPDLKIEAAEAKFRSWTGEYSGTSQVGELVPWYLTEMKAHQWKYRRLEERGPDGKTLYFEKGDEVSKVDFSRRIEPKEGGYITIVRAEIHPKGPEDFTVEEHLRMKESGIRPASYSKKSSGSDDLEAAPAVDREGEEGLDNATEKTAKGKAKNSIRNAKLEDTDGEESPPRAGALKDGAKAKPSRRAPPKELQELEDSAR